MVYILVNKNSSVKLLIIYLILTKMTPKINVNFTVCGKGFSLSPDGNSPYSKEYYKRYSQAVNGKLSFNEVYGLDQAKEHIEAMRIPSNPEYDEYWKNVPLWIERTISITDIIK